MTTLFVNNLTVIDCSYLHPSRGIVGESWIVDVELTGNLDEEGVIFDFSHAKKAIKSLIDNSVDHNLLVPALDKQLNLQEKDSQVYLEYTFGKEELSYSCPTTSIQSIEDKEITEKSVEKFLIHLISSELPSNIVSLSITLRSESIDGAFYHYSHGLKKHYGNCQRMAHGHRSRIQIFSDNNRREDLEEKWSKRWEDIYLGSKEDLLLEENTSSYTFEYIGIQGSYRLIYPKIRCEIINSDTTVELLAEHIKEVLTADGIPNISVYAYEGIEKGAVAKTF